MPEEKKQYINPTNAVILIMSIFIFIFWLMPICKTVYDPPIRINGYNLMFNKDYRVGLYLWVFVFQIIIFFASIAGDYKIVKSAIIPLSLFNLVISVVGISVKGLQITFIGVAVAILYIVISVTAIYDLATDKE